MSHNLIPTTYVVDKIRKIRENKGFAQQQMSDLVGMHRSNFSKVETAQRELSIIALAKVAMFFDLSLDQLVNSEGNVPKEVTFEDKTSLKKIKLIGQLELKYGISFNLFYCDQT